MYVWRLKGGWTVGWQHLYAVLIGCFGGGCKGLPRFTSSVPNFDCSVISNYILILQVPAWGCAVVQNRDDVWVQEEILSRGRLVVAADAALVLVVMRGDAWPVSLPLVMDHLHRQWRWLSPFLLSSPTLCTCLLVQAIPYLPMQCQLPVHRMKCERGRGGDEYFYPQNTIF